MSLVTSGTIGIGGTDPNTSLNLQLLRVAGSTTSMNESASRTFAGVSSTSGSSYSMAEFYGRGYVGGGVWPDSVDRWSMDSSAGGGATAVSTFNFNSDGSSQILVFGAGQVANPVWYAGDFGGNPGIGNSYWIRATLVSSFTSGGGTNTFTGSYGTWLSLSTQKTWSVSCGAPDGVAATHRRTVTFEISTDSGGSLIVATHTGNVLSATKYII
jgi:hypothetical protein